MATETRLYTYGLVVRLGSLLLSLNALAAGCYIVVVPVWRASLQHQPLTPGALIDAAFWGAGLAICGLVAGNFHPEVTSDGEGLTVSFLWCRLRVRWHDILQVRPYSPWPHRDVTTWVVTTRALTPLHRLYGLMYARSRQPSFIIHRMLPGHEELLRTIESHLQISRAIE